MDAYASVISNNMNTIMKQMTSLYYIDDSYCDWVFTGWMFLTATEQFDGIVDCDYNFYSFFSVLEYSLFKKKKMVLK
jgi:hypothetical protein